MSRDHSSTSVNTTASSGIARCHAVSWGASTLLLAAFLGSTANPSTAQQPQANVEALLEKARGEENAGNYGAAESTYKQTLAVDPENL